MVVDGDQDDAVRGEQAAGQQQSGKEHGAPVGVIPAVRKRVFPLKVDLPLRVPVSAGTVIYAAIHHKGIRIDEIAAGVVGRVQVDHLHRAQITLLEDFQHFQIVSLDVEVPGGVPIPAVRLHGAEGSGGGAGGLGHGGPFADPGEFVAILPLRHVGGQQLLEDLEVDGLFHLPVRASRLRDGGGKQRGDFFHIPRRQAGGFQVQMVHVCFLPFHADAGASTGCRCRRRPGALRYPRLHPVRRRDTSSLPHNRQRDKLKIARPGGALSHFPPGCMISLIRPAERSVHNGQGKWRIYFFISFTSVGAPVFSARVPFVSQTRPLQGGNLPCSGQGLDCIAERFIRDAGDQLLMDRTAHSSKDP